MALSRDDSPVILAPAKRFIPNVISFVIDRLRANNPLIDEINFDEYTLFLAHGYNRENQSYGSVLQICNNDEEKAETDYVNIILPYISWTNAFTQFDLDTEYHFNQYDQFKDMCQKYGLYIDKEVDVEDGRLVYIAPYDFRAERYPKISTLTVHNPLGAEYIACPELDEEDNVFTVVKFCKVEGVSETQLPVDPNATYSREGITNVAEGFTIAPITPTESDIIEM